MAAEKSTKLAGKHCLITGAGQGIGEAIARHFVAAGASVLVTDREADKAKRVAQSMNQGWRQLDVADEAAWDQLLVDIPTIDVLVNNAGITGFEGQPAPQDPENAQLADWRRVHAVNLEGTFLGCRYALKAMRAKAVAQKAEGGVFSGSIINISSRSGMVGIPRAAAYASSKAAIRNHTKSVALYAQEEGLNIRCNSIHPAAILTPMWEPMLGEGEAREAAIRTFTKDTPMGRFGTADEVASVALMLASDDSSYITGAEFTIDGGILAGSAASPSS